jgi:16S rRNA (uracil1498-N3)-methyltransferase
VRLQRIVREAAEQSERVTLPQIEQPQDLPSFLRTQPVIALAERSGAAPLVDVEIPDDAALAIGPEGGWSLNERTWIDAHAASTASLGSLILRAETAAIAAAALVLQRSRLGDNDR